MDDLIFSIIEYCPKDKLIEREQYWIDTLKPEFNICKIAGFTLGVKYSEKAKRNLRRA
jgi:group I intron endonuclease